jgi:hypothetical protein
MNAVTPIYDTEIGRIIDPIERYFAYARERQKIYLSKQKGDPFPWTNDPIMQKHKLTNVFREQDKTTAWLRTFVREPLRKAPVVLFANLVFRWFNRIEVGEILFCHPDLWRKTLFENYLEFSNRIYVENSIRKHIPKGPWTTGAYLITSPKGFDKLAGICINIDYFHKNKFVWHEKPCHWFEVAEYLLANRGQVSMEEVWNWLTKVPFQGTFHAHENVIDLRYTDLLDMAPDINTWTNPGPGAMKGLAIIHSREGEAVSRKQAIWELRQLLNYSRDPALWPSDWQPWELHQAEMWACEFAKLERVYHGGSTRSMYVRK